MPRPLLQVSGLRELVREIGKAEEGVSSLRESMKAISQFVIRKAVPRTPVRTGRLASTYTFSKTKGKATVRNRTVYAGVQEFGFPRLNIRPQRMVLGAIDNNHQEIIGLVQDELDKIKREFND